VVVAGIFGIYRSIAFKWYIIHGYGGFINEIGKKPWQFRAKKVMKVKN